MNFRFIFMDILDDRFVGLDFRQRFLFILDFDVLSAHILTFFAILKTRCRIVVHLPYFSTNIDLVLVES